MTNRLPVDDIPPPPYSETDIYSNSGDASSPVLSSSHRQTPYGRENVPQSPPSTIDGEVIYTPPLTPRSAQQSNFNFAHSDIDHLTTSSAAAYFDTRPAPPQHIIQARPALVHAITLKDDTSPDSLPYPTELFSAEPERDITPQDWQTFVNYLIPHYHAISNEQIIDRKLRAEGLSSNSSLSGNGGGNNTPPSTIGNPTTLPEAQLGQIRVTTTSPDTARRQVMEQTVREWNEGFFAPRGVTVRVVNWNSTTAREGGGEDVQHAMPGGWDTSFDQGETSAAGTAAAAAGSRSRFARFMPQFGVPGPGGSRGFGLGIGGGPGNSFRLGGIAVDGDRFSIGKGIVADRNGLRIGGMVADTNGISLNGQPMFGGPPGGAPRGFPPGAPGGGFGGWGFGGGRGRGGGGRGCNDGGSWGRGWGGRGGGRGSWAGRGHWGQDEKGEDDHDHGRSRRGRRRERHHDEPRHRSRSHSASSSSSSLSSSSESSIGSLPDHDELRDTQLPVTRQHLLAWLHDPNQPITKDQLKEAKQKIKEAKNANPSGINEPTNIAYDQKAMRKEVKALLKDWRDLKKHQTKLRRQLRRERKQQRRAEKRERRTTRREMKRAARDQKRAVRNGTASAGGSFPLGAGFPGAGFPLAPPDGSFPLGIGVASARSPPVPGGGRSTFPFGPRGLFGGGGPFYSPLVPQSEGNIVVIDQAPGAWPTDDYDARDHRVSQGIYTAADDIESELVEKETELFKLHEAIALKNEAQAQSGSRGFGGGSGGGIRDDKQVLAARELGEEIRELAEKMSLLRTEADAEFARELAQMGHA